eukprot:TRINITY_DN38974_c0_g1_i1.p1 TRINITY_DN38974_c0_g1~~TRINITY_DN38974_c0_g1_i1.p1  ORF type:complete len:469 (-),score=33.61 TRINITY_DN38974_c0_g1_i1:110-1516(-)
MVLIISDSWMNENVTYNTIKYVSIMQWQLGFMRYAIMVGVGAWLVVYKMLFLGQHLINREIDANVRLTLNTPRFGLPLCDDMSRHCNHAFQSLSDLPYCLQCSARPFPESYIKQCKYYDTLSVFSESNREKTMILTYLADYHQVVDCVPSVENDFSCDGIYRFLQQHIGMNDARTQNTSSKDAFPIEEFFVADIERYTLHVEHSFHTTSGSKRIQKFFVKDMPGGWCQMQGEATQCKWHPSLCIANECSEGSLTTDMLNVSVEYDDERGRDATSRFWKRPNSLRANDYPMLTWNASDVFTVGGILDMAGIKLDVDANTSEEQSLRKSGLTIEMQIEYTNVHPWIGLWVWPWSASKPDYTFKFRQVPEMLAPDVIVSEDSSKLVQGRAGSIRHHKKGILLKVTQIGSLLEWDTFSLLVLVSATGSLWLGIQLALDLFLLYLSNYAAKYTEIIYDMRAVDGEDPKSPRAM